MKTPKTRKFWNWTKNEETQERILHLNGTIAEESWFDDDVTPKIFEGELKAEDGDVVVWINSPGGDCFAASQIYNMLKEYSGNVTVKVDGIAASAASVIAMAGDSVFVSPVSMIMIHNPLTAAFGNAEDMQKAIEMLDSVKDSIINAYELKTGLSRSKISHLMDNETWMDAYKAVELGFADEVLYTKAEKPDEDNDEDEDEDEQELFKKNAENAMLFSRREVNTNIVNKVSEHFKNQEPAPKPQENNVPEHEEQPTTNERSVDMLMERLELIKKHI